jgi:type VI secretion system secreted protein Hcp
MSDTDCFLQWPDVKGEAADAKHEKWITVFSWSLGVSQASVGGVTQGKSSWTNMNLVIGSSTATTALMQICAEGKKLEGKQAVLVQQVAAEGGHVEQVKITLEGALITSFTIGGSSGSSARTDAVTISYDVIKFEYTPVEKGKKGPASTMAWNVYANKKG